jgi:AcrR family transcriptional regulator
MLKRPNPDRRIQRTRQALMSAFIELVLTRGYESLTAGDISRKANVGRSTFYLHYANKEALLAESIRNPSNQMAACVGGDVTPPKLVPLLDHFREQRIVNRTFFADPIRSLWVKSLASLIEPRLTLLARTSGIRSDLPRSLVALMMAEMQIALITHWVTKRSTLKSELVAATLVANTHAMLSAFGGSERSH